MSQKKESTTQVAKVAAAYTQDPLFFVRAYNGLLNLLDRYLDELQVQLRYVSCPTLQRLFCQMATRYGAKAILEVIAIGASWYAAPAVAGIRAATLVRSTNTSAEIINFILSRARAVEKGKEFEKKIKEKVKDIQRNPGGLENKLKEYKINVDPSYLPIYKEVYRLLDDPDRSIFQLRELVDDVLLVLENHPRSTPRSALETVLSRWESRSGFGKTSEVRDTLSTPEFNDMLRKGQLFTDFDFDEVSVTEGGHGQLTHRIQWNLVMREMAREPNRFLTSAGERIQPVEVYRSMGAVPNEAVDMNVVWFYTFDSEESSFTSPEFF